MNQNLKRQSQGWHMPGSPGPIKFRQKQGNLKMMMIFAYDIHGILAANQVWIRKRPIKSIIVHF